MSQREDIIRIRHMLDAARKAAEFVRSRHRNDLDRDEQLAFSLTHLLEIIGEAAGKVSAESQKANPAIPWPKIVGMRNRLIHAYFDIDLDEIWRTVQEDLPPLIADLERVVSSYSRDIT